MFENVVARDGIEPPTPAFSGLLTDTVKWFRINGSLWWRISYAKRLVIPTGIVWAPFRAVDVPLLFLQHGDQESGESKPAPEKVADQEEPNRADSSSFYSSIRAGRYFCISASSDKRDDESSLRRKREERRNPRRPFWSSGLANFRCIRRAENPCRRRRHNRSCG